MIITDLLAENFRKYENLHLENIPETGLIALKGGNEAGKSSIGDALCFALFGCTDKLSGERIGKLVRWGEEHVKVNLSFKHKDQHYRLTRMADTEGTQTASLWRADEDRALVDGSEEVATQLREILGYGYPTFVRTFYWSQQISEDLQADTESLQAMAGIKTYIQLDESLRNEYQHDAQVLEQLQADYQVAADALEAVQVNKDFLPQLVDIRENLEERQRDSLALARDISKVRESYTGNHGLFHRFNSISRRISWLTSVGVVLLLLALLAWAVLTFMPGLFASVWPEGAAEPEVTGRSFLWAGVILAMLGSLMMFYGWYIESRMHPLHDDAEKMADAVRYSSEQLNSSMTDLIGTDAEAYLSRYAHFDIKNAAGLEWQSDAANLQRLSDEIRTYEADPLDTVAAADGVSLALERQNESLLHYLDAVERDVDAERGHVDHFITMSDKARERKQPLDNHQHQMRVKQKALSLLNKAAKQAIQNFSQAVHQHSSGLLSDFTQSSYNNLEIDTDFVVRVLSEEKGDYLELEEISAGTQRQIILAMRMALADALADSTGAKQQFIFLDEPFAFFDPERTTATINSLVSATTGRLSQVWVTVQELPADLQASYLVDCRQKNPTLRVM